MCPEKLTLQNDRSFESIFFVQYYIACVTNFCCFIIKYVCPVIKYGNFLSRFFDRKIHTSWKWRIFNQIVKICYICLIWIFMAILIIWNWKLSKLKVAKIESSQFWKLPKLKVISAFLAKLPSCQIAMSSKIL